MCIRDRIDVLATAIHAGLSALQLKDLDLAYAPPYSSCLLYTSRCV